MTFLNTKRFNTNTILGLFFITVFIFMVLVSMPMVSFSDGGGDGGGGGGGQSDDDFEDPGFDFGDQGQCGNDAGLPGNDERAGGEGDYGDIASDPDTVVTSNICTLNAVPASLIEGTGDVTLTVSDTGGVTSMNVERNSTNIGTISTTFTDTNASTLSPGNYTYSVSGSRTWLADPRLPQNGCAQEAYDKDGTYCVLYNQTTYLHTTSCTDDVTITSVPTPPPTNPTFSATPSSINSGNSTTLQWSCVDSSSSSGVNFPTGGAVSGSASVSPTTTTNYSVLCSNGGQSSLNVTVIDPTLSITATPSLLSTGSTSVINWSATSVNSCQISENSASISDAWSGTSGSQTTSPIVEETTYTLSCQTDGGPVSDTAVIKLVPVFEEF